VRALLNPREKREKKGKKRNILSIEREGSSEKKREKERERERERVCARSFIESINEVFSAYSLIHAPNEQRKR